jgi:hypothetical protein
MMSEYPFESLLVRNRLGQGMKLLVCPFSLAKEHVCVLVAVDEGAHWSLLSKNAEYIILQLRERFSRKVKNFSMIEIRMNSNEEQSEENWYDWKFNWAGSTPLDAKCHLLSPQKQDYYQKIILGLDKKSNAV